MSDKKHKQEDGDTMPPPPQLSNADLGELHRAAAAGENGETDDDWNPDAAAPPEQPIDPASEKKKRGPGRPKTEKPTPAPRKMKPIEIRAGAIVKEIFCHFSYDQNLAPTITNGIDVKSEIPAHDDLRNTFKQLAPHLAFIFRGMTLDEFEAINWDSEEDPNLLNLRRFEVTQFFLDKYGDDETVVLIGTEELPTGSARLITPAIRFVNSKYQYIGDLREKIDACLFEIEEYLFGRKKADDKQLSLGL